MMNGDDDVTDVPWMSVIAKSLEFRNEQLYAIDTCNGSSVL